MTELWSEIINKRVKIENFLKKLKQRMYANLRILVYLEKATMQRSYKLNGGPRPSIFELELPLSDICWKEKKISQFKSVVTGINKCHSREVLVQI